MVAAIVGAVVGAVLGWLIAFITMVYNNKETIKIIETKLEDLAKKVEKHNNLVERTYKLEEDMTWVRHELENKE